MRFPKLWIAIYYLVKGGESAANYSNNLSTEFNKYCAKSRAMVRNTNRNFKLIRSMTKILHVLPHKKCSAGHHTPITGISESEGIERNRHILPWKNFHMKKQVQKDRAIPSWTKASNMKRWCIVSHARPKWDRSCKQLVNIKRKRLRSAGCIFGDADAEQEAGQKQSWLYQIRHYHQRN